MAAEAVAAWLATIDDHRSTVIMGADPLLDAALRRHGLPTVGASPSRHDNSLLEILPLIIQLGWSPADPARALELLTIPNSPIPRGIRGRLAGALKRWPAVDSDAWRLALSEGLEKIEDTRNRKRVADRLAVLLQPSVAGTHYPIAEAKRRVQVLVQWLQGMAGTEAAPEDYQAAVIQCANFNRLLDLAGLAELTRPQLQRFLEDATEDVPVRPRFAAQAGLFPVPMPGAIGGPAERIIWWTFARGSAPRPERLPLSPEERPALSNAGVFVPERAAESLKINARWARPLQNATASLMLVCPRYGDDGEPVHPHPLWDQIAANAGPAEIQKLVVRTPMFPRSPARTTPLPLLPPQPRRRWQLPEGVAVASRETESPSGAGALVGCSFQWTLQYACGIRGGDTAELLSGDRLVGSVAHEILAQVLRSRPATPEIAENEARRLFDAEAPRLAAPLFMAGAEKLKQQSRRATVQSAKFLVKHLLDSNLDVVGVEKVHDGKAFGSGFAGRLDLVVGPTKGVVDLKWGGEKYRRELAAGAAYQLASYAHLLREGALRAPANARGRRRS